MSFAEIMVVALVFVLASWYWPVEEHIVYLLILILVVLFATKNGVRFFGSGSNLVPTGFFLSLLSWLGFSTFWSSEFHLSLAYAALVVTLGLTAVALGVAFRLEVITTGLVVGMALILAHGVLRALLGGAGLGTYLAIDDKNPDTLGLPWGLFTNPSGLSALIGVTIISVAFSFSQKREVFAIVILVGGVLVNFILALEILAPIFSLVVAAAVAGALWHVRSTSGTLQSMLGITYPALFLLSGLTFWVFREPLLRPLGELPDLSGRVIVWEWYYEAFLWAPVIGTGWGSSRGAPPLTEETTVPVKEWFLAHNGFIDLSIMLGLVGLLLLLGTLFSLLIIGIRRSVDQDFSFRWAFLPVLIVYLSLNDLMASILPRFVGFFLLGIMVGSLLRREASS